MRALHLRGAGAMRSKAGTLTVLAGLLSAIVSLPASAALTDISQVPLLVSFGVPVKPNLQLIMDNSISMTYTFLPEAAYDDSRNFYVSRSAQCNSLAFDPAKEYLPPYNSDGSRFADASVAAAFTMPVDEELSSWGDMGIDTATVSVGSTIRMDWPAHGYGQWVTIFHKTDPAKWAIGFISEYVPRSRRFSGRTTITITHTSHPSVTLTDPNWGKGFPFFVYFEYDGDEHPLNWRPNGSGGIENNTFRQECRSHVYHSGINFSTPAPLGHGKFTMNFVRPDSDAALVQKYANWRHYYRDRLRMMKVVTAEAFLNIDDSFRVGYTYISNKLGYRSTDAKNWLDIGDFNATQKALFYDYLHSTSPSGSTPLRGALSLTGRYFAKKAPSQVSDPIQHSCQKNFALLATDGGWNTGNETDTYGPFDLDGDAVGQRDGTAARPMRDSTTESVEGPANTLADVAMYYYETDLRDSSHGNQLNAAGQDVSENSVPVVGRDTARHQHMSTYTLNLGQVGALKYCIGYDAVCAIDPVTGLPGTSDYPDLVLGNKQWGTPAVTTHTGGNAHNIDDLWHAAVNGRGLYFNTFDARSVADGLRRALTEIERVSGRGASGATSNQFPVEGDNDYFVGGFTSGFWSGELRAHEVDLATNTPKMKDPATGADVYRWSAHARLAAATTRNIYFESGGELKAFNATELEAAGLESHFVDRCSALSQYSGLSATDKADCNSMENLVSYLSGSEKTYYRGRSSKLGDLVGSAPIFDGRRGAPYTDAGYADFVSGTRATRRKMVYVGSNDGMVHAFDAATGDEVWAFIPKAVLPRLYKLADRNYGANHEYFVDGPAVTADVKIGDGWKTILVGGLGAGGRSYYAIDVTNPDRPQFLWEFTDANLGLTFAKPIVTRRKSNGAWVVVVPSGYNNVGDGRGRIFMINVADGSLQAEFVTPASTVELPTGDGSNPAGMGPVNAWLHDRTQNIAQRFYAGDNLGNLWRFDTEELIHATDRVIPLARFVKDGRSQPITTRPQLAQLSISGFDTPAVFVGTGRLVGSSDMSDTSGQSIYGIKDKLEATGWGDIRSLDSGGLVAQVVSSGVGGVRTTSHNLVNWAEKAGWYLDLPEAGERINVPPAVIANTLLAASNVPESVRSCESGGDGHSWLYAINLATGGADGIESFPSAMIVGVDVIGGNMATPGFTDGSVASRTIPGVSGVGTIIRRSNWRELSDR